VNIGDLVIGDGQPVMIQSMTTTPTQDIDATVQQCIRLAEVGCQMIRITAPGVKDAQALAAIRRDFNAAGFQHIPLCADIHFMPAAALEAALHVEKVRINPGNFADKKRFEQRDYTDVEYQAELERIRERFTPLVAVMREHGRAMRIGVNHGSLSDRIMNRYGDTPQGMVESALEFCSIAEDNHFQNIVISMKSSNPKVMVHAYRLLARTLADRGTPYPLHLGVTEAGDGEDGRLKGAAGIGALLADGIGDTIRVSLTEEPKEEVPVAQQLAAQWHEKTFPVLAGVDPVLVTDYQRRNADILRWHDQVPVGGGKAPTVVAPSYVPHDDQMDPEADAWTALPGPAGDAPRRRLQAPQVAWDQTPHKHFEPQSTEELQCALDELDEPTLISCASLPGTDLIRTYRWLSQQIDRNFTAAEAAALGSGIRHPLLLQLSEPDLLRVAAVAGSLLIDGLLDAVLLDGVSHPVRIGFGLLQATKARTSKADYVACPSCGRTLFDLIEVTAHVKEATAHLKGLTIAVMGCIVNGPGEMADADYGFVGTGPGKVTIYRGKEPVRKNIVFDDARQALIDTIAEDGNWHEPNPSQGTTKA
jgi:(E)-4-hydroxy-3-methylbut-2-enyl-diphosphate synthase